jgi:hypothetical protein
MKEKNRKANSKREKPPRSMNGNTFSELPKTKKIPVTPAPVVP